MRAAGFQVQPALQPTAQPTRSGAKPLFVIATVLLMAALGVGGAAILWKRNSFKRVEEASVSQSPAASTAAPVPDPTKDQTAKSSLGAQCPLSAEELSTISGLNFKQNATGAVKTEGRPDSPVCNYSLEDDPLATMYIQVNWAGGRELISSTDRSSSDWHEYPGIGDEGGYSDFSKDFQFRKGEVGVIIVASLLEYKSVVKSARDLEIAIAKRIAAKL
jgi:hypothetical protein